MSGRRRVKAAELDAKLNYDLTRSWFAAVRNHGTVSASYIIHVERERKARLSGLS